MRDINKLMLAFFFTGTICTASSVCAMNYGGYGYYNQNIAPQREQMQARYPRVCRLLRCMKIRDTLQVLA